MTYPTIRTSSAYYFSRLKENQYTYDDLAPISYGSVTDDGKIVIITSALLNTVTVFRRDPKDTKVYNYSAEFKGFNSTVGRAIICENGKFIVSIPKHSVYHFRVNHRLEISIPDGNSYKYAGIVWYETQKHRLNQHVVDLAYAKKQIYLLYTDNSLDVFDIDQQTFKPTFNKTYTIKYKKPFKTARGDISVSKDGSTLIVGLGLYDVVLVYKYNKSHDEFELDQEIAQVDNKDDWGNGVKISDDGHFLFVSAGGIYVYWRINNDTDFRLIYNKDVIGIRSLNGIANPKFSDHGFIDATADNTRLFIFDRNFNIIFYQSFELLNNIIEATKLTKSFIPATKIEPAKAIKKIPATKLTPAKTIIPATKLTPATKITVPPTTVPFTKLEPSKTIIPATKLTPSKKLIQYVDIDEKNIQEFINIIEAENYDGSVLDNILFDRWYYLLHTMLEVIRNNYKATATTLSTFKNIGLAIDDNDVATLDFLLSKFKHLQRIKLLLTEKDLDDADKSASDNKKLNQTFIKFLADITELLKKINDAVNTINNITFNKPSTTITNVPTNIDYLVGIEPEINLIQSEIESLQLLFKQTNDAFRALKNTIAPYKKTINKLKNSDLVMLSSTDKALEIKENRLPTTDYPFTLPVDLPKEDNSFLYANEDYTHLRWNKPIKNNNVLEQSNPIESYYRVTL